MRIAPVVQASRNFVNNSNNKKMNNSAFNIQPHRNVAHQYSGVPSVDLAYASMFDKEIARDLKLMGLI